MSAICLELGMLASFDKTYILLHQQLQGIWVFFPFYTTTLLQIPIEIHCTLIGKWVYMPGILNIPGIHQHGHLRSFEFFVWCISGICHIPHIHQTLSHLQKIPICNDIGLFVVMYARRTPLFFGHVENC